MESFLTHWGYAAIFLFGFLEACCIPIPSEITFGFAGVLAGEGHLNIVAVIVVGTIAELVGSYVAYGVGRVGGRPLVHRFGRYLLITQADIDRAERFVAGRGIWAIPVGRALPIVRTFVSIVAGFIEVPPLLFGVLSLIGTAVWVTVISLVGYGVGSAWQSVAHGLAVAGYVIFVVVVIAIAAFITYRVREVRREAAHERGGPEAGGGDANGTHQRGSDRTEGRSSNGTDQRGGTDQGGSGGTDQGGSGGTDQRGSGGTDQRGSGGAHRRGASDHPGTRREAGSDAQPSPRSPTS
jgi:membrane protein DedA with SNARE-associated domain